MNKQGIHEAASTVLPFGAGTVAIALAVGTLFYRGEAIANFLPIMGFLVATIGAGAYNRRTGSFIGMLLCVFAWLLCSPMGRDVSGWR